VIIVRNYIAAFFAHSVKNAPALRATRVINEASAALSATFVWQYKRATPKTKNFIQNSFLTNT
jgi:hypothetical protein